MTPVSRRSSLILVAALWAAIPVLGSDPSIEIDIKAGKTRPIALAGYSPEVERILSFDLRVVGFEVVRSGANLELRGGAGPDVQGTLTEGGTARFSRAYPGGGLRSQAHALADDVVKEILHIPGIARTRIAFRRFTGGRSERGDRISEIVVSDYDGANQVAVTSDNNVALAPAWVPGRLALYYTSYRSRYPDIYSHDLTTGSRTIFAQFPGLNTSAAISPDGRRVAMILSKTGHPNLWVGDAGGGAPQQLTKSLEMEASPCWSPDGRTICFTSTAEGKAALFTVSPAGGAMRRLSTGGILNCTEPDWSPDGRFIAFTRASGEFSLYLVPAAGGAATDLRTPGEDPSWSPNSRTLIFTRGRDQQRRLSLLDVQTGHVEDVPGTTGNCSQPSWAR